MRIKFKTFFLLSFLFIPLSVMASVYDTYSLISESNATKEKKFNQFMDGDFDEIIRFNKGESLEKILEAIQAYQSESKKVLVTIVGHVSEGMSEEDSLEASKNKALEVENYFTDNGIDKSVLFIEPRGSKDPLYATKNLSERVMVTIYVNFPRDLDGDGVDIDMDECPNTTKGHKVGENGCKLKMMVVLLEGKKESSSVNVGTKAGDMLIDKPNQLVGVVSQDVPPTPPREVSKEELTALMDNTAEGSDKEELSFVLYFKGLKLLGESMEKTKEIFEKIAQRKNAYITIIGHTDTVGSMEKNHVMSEKRAQVVKDLILEAQVPHLKIDTQAYSESNLAVQTRDEVSEPLNRRVEIFIN